MVKAIEVPQEEGPTVVVGFTTILLCWFTPFGSAKHCVKEQAVPKGLKIASFLRPTSGPISYARAF